MYSVVESQRARVFFEPRATIETDWSMSYANHVRRALLTEIPTWAVDSGIVIENTSNMHDD
jgi:DNA-directed RNA polymerase alpha subunit